MALVICCPCGNPLDCDHLELVVSLTCPRCEREIALELELEQGRTALAVLTATEGPYWVGEQFVIPVGANLQIGSADTNWLSLQSDAMSDVHCSLQLTPQGNVIVEDHKSATGTWIGSQRIARGKLAPMQSLSIGGFRFRLDLQSADGTTTVGAQPPIRRKAPAQQPMLKSVKRDQTFESGLVRSRFLLSRRGLTATAWLLGVYHACSLLGDPAHSIPWPAALMFSALIVVALLASNRHVALTHPVYKYISMVVLALIAVADILWDRPGPAIVCLGIAGCLAALVTRVVSNQVAVAAVISGGCFIIVSAILAINSLIMLLGAI
jgi:hypothetical protein